MLRQTQPSLHRHHSPGTTNGQTFGRCFGRPSTCVRQQRPGPSSSVYSPAAVRGNTIGASHLRLSSGLRQRQDASTVFTAQARSGHSGDAPSGADSIHLSGVVVDSDAFYAAFPGLLTGAAGAELVVNTPSSDHSSTTGQGVPLVPHDCTITNTSPQLRQHPSITIRAPSSLGEALPLEPGSILDLQLSGSEVVAVVAGQLRAPPPPANTVTLARVVVLGDLYVSPDIHMTVSHFKWTTPIRIRLEIMNQLLGSQARSTVVAGSSYDVHSAVPPVQSPAAAAAGAGAVVATLNLHLNESKGTSYWRLLDGIHSWAERLGGVGGDALRLALAVGDIQEVGGKDTLVKTLITARLVKRTTAGGVVAAAAADTAPPEAAVAPPPPPAAAAGVVPAPSSTPAAVAPGSIARPRRAPQRGKSKAKNAQQDAAAAASDLQQLNRTAELVLAALERIEVLLRERQQQQQQQQRAE